MLATQSPITTNSTALHRVKDIPVHQLQQRSGEGIVIKYFTANDGNHEEVKALGAHRDDHYMFFMMEKGSVSLMVDFQEIHTAGTGLYYILPGQVHHVLNNPMAEGWFVAVDTSLVPPDYRAVFEDRLILQQPHLLSQPMAQQCRNLLTLLNDKYTEDTNGSFYLPVIHSLLQSFIGLVATCYSTTCNQRLQLSRPVQLSAQFKKLLTQHVRTIKSPSAYAAKLNVSESYLNEVLKKTTGMPVSYWILQEVMLEARRLLYYSQLNVKEIAHTLGYEDHTYFSKLFKKAAGNTPLTFRGGYRK